jgi:hypothetical protein
MTIDLTTVTGPGEGNSPDNPLDDPIWDMLQNSLNKITADIDLVKAFMDPRTSETAKIEILKNLNEPLDSHLKLVALHGLCKSTEPVRKAVIDLFKKQPDAANSDLSEGIASLILHDDAAVRNSISEIAKIEKLALKDIALQAEAYQLKMFTDPRTCDAERTRIVARLKNASTPTLQNLAVHGMNSESKKVRTAVEKVIKASKIEIAPKPLESLSYVERFIDPRTSEQERISQVKGVRGELKREIFPIFLHGLCGESAKVRETIVRLFSDVDRIREDDLREMFMDLCKHEDKKVAAAASKIMTDDSFMLGSFSRQSEIEGVQIDAFKDPRTCDEQKIKIARRLKWASASKMEALALYGLHNESDKVRDAVIKTVKTNCKGSVKSFVSELCQSKIPYVSQAAKEILGKD